jgi:hypothetical protein
MSDESVSSLGIVVFIAYLSAGAIGSAFIFLFAVFFALAFV